MNSEHNRSWSGFCNILAVIDAEIFTVSCVVSQKLLSELIETERKYVRDLEEVRRAEMYDLYGAIIS